MIKAIEWYDGVEGYAFPDVPCLVVAFDNGRVQVMRSEEDARPVLIDCGLALVQARWNSTGTVLALAGTRTVGGKEVSEVQFYTPWGRYITALKVPGGTINAVTWEGGGLRLAVSTRGLPPWCARRHHHR
jgi:WD repeat-containing protein 35